MKEPRYTIALDNLTICDVLEVSEAVARYGTGSYRPTKKLASEGFNAILL